MALGCLRLVKHLLLGAPRTQLPTQADARSAPASPPPAATFSQYQEQQQPALPPLRTKPANRHSPRPGASAGGGLSPTASPRKAHPAAAGAAAALGEAAAASKSAPSTPSAASGGSVHPSNASDGSASMPSSTATAADSVQLSKGVPAKAATDVVEAPTPLDCETSPVAGASGAPCTPSAVEEPAEAILQRNSVVAAA